MGQDLFKEIAELLAKIKKAKAEEEAAAMEVLASPSTPKTPRTPLTAKALNSVGGLLMNTPKTTKKERKAAKKMAKALEREKVVTALDIDAVAKILHPKSEEELVADVEMEEPDEDPDIKMNLKFNNSTCNSKSARHDYIIKDRERSDVDDSTVKNVLIAMEVDPQAKGKEGELVRELAEAVKKDLVHFYDELKIVARNKGGFWRWAHKRAYRDLVENGKEWDAKHAKDAEHAAKDADQVNDAEDRVDYPDERRPSDQSIDTEEDNETVPSRKGSIDSSAPPSVGTALTIPSTKGSAKKKKNTLSISVPTKKTESDDDEGWMPVGKKVLKTPVKGTLSLSSNGGLHHLAAKPRPKPKSGVWSFSDLE
ncbi:hypothetical protein PRZ48_014612 [Zasmidium cellare]|uniref:Uncharacterized protein n=1 Tax=Zasmidium cellare TaxID=395010 RepID=A0ABR0DYS9_ZASCE|nr:hypothetical protein PRZ48_014612 [Zasmidium cellare]